MNKLKQVLFSPITFAALLIIAATSMGIATFIENDFGPAGSRAAVYNTKWFELVLIFITINMLGSIFTRKLYRKGKLSVFLFHFAFSIILIGAGITRYHGYEGVMHIREGQSSNEILIQEKVLSLKSYGSVEKDSIIKVKKDLVKHPSLNKSVTAPNGEIHLKLKSVAPNAFKQAIEVSNGVPVIGFVASGKEHRGFEHLKQGEDLNFGDLSISFEGTIIDADINFSYHNDTFYIKTKEALFSSNMGGDKALINANTSVFVPKKLFTTQNVNIVAQNLFSSGKIEVKTGETKMGSKSTNALVFEVSDGTNSKDVIVWDMDGYYGEFTDFQLNGENYGLAYSFNRRQVDFSLFLDDFKIERYPGSNSPSSFSSFVTIIENDQEAKPFHIYMNNILKHGGYRFYQSSYDNDEKGTVLSVNRDALGTTITYIGYFLLFAGLILSMANKNTYLWNAKIKVDKIAGILLLFLLLSASVKADNLPKKENAVSVEQANAFGELLIQNTKGRTEPVYTFASDIVRKISRTENLYGLNPVQVFIEMNLDFNYWRTVPVIKVSNKELQQIIGINSNFAAYDDFLDGNRYKLQQLIDQAYGKAPVKRSKFDKSVMKVDERMNILFSIFAGNYFKIFPLPDQSTTQWYTPEDAYTKAIGAEDSTFLANVIPYYFNELTSAKASGNYQLADEILIGMKSYQRRFANYDLPSVSKTKLEIFYAQLNPFNKLFKFYSLIGALFLFTLIFLIIRGGKQPTWLMNSYYFLIMAGFLIHTLGLAIRWYLSGHAPMSNGYESMIFIAWVTVLAGFLFNKNSSFALAATSVLAGFTLMVANLSFLDPQITNLVPVLQSYWLTLHVSIITGSYGFLALGMLLGLINLILFIARNRTNEGRINETIETLSVINNKSLTFGLYFLTIGNFLGAIWANESWGRYWGWDPKETWSLITIIIYTLVTHARMIPGLKGVFTYNVLSIYAFFSVLMTYFGVNYYLSGLHSYAAGEPVPVPTFVYYTVASLIIITFVSYYRTKQVQKT